MILIYNIVYIIDSVIQRNGYFVHSENILFAKYIDCRWEVTYKRTRFVWERVLKFKVNLTLVLNEIRIFKVQTINFDAKDYTEWID